MTEREKSTPSAGERMAQVIYHAFSYFRLKDVPKLGEIIDREMGQAASPRVYTDHETGSTWPKQTRGEVKTFQMLPVDSGSQRERFSNGALLNDVTRIAYAYERDRKEAAELLREVIGSIPDQTCPKCGWHTQSRQASEPVGELLEALRHIREKCNYAMNSHDAGLVIDGNSTAEICDEMEAKYGKGNQTK